jgi:hypothetical protein
MIFVPKPVPVMIRSGDIASVRSPTLKILSRRLGGDFSGNPE